MHYSQDKQDEFLETTVFKGYKNGYFVDVGAHDGVSLNNSLYFEKYHNWSGINIEPIKTVYDKLSINRPNCINVNCAVSNNDGETEFLCCTGRTEMLSGIKATYDARHINRVKLENKRFKGTSQTIIVPTRRLETILDEYKITHINYLSIDVEGAEFEVIKSINFDKVFIDVIGFENNYIENSLPIIEYLQSKKYIIIRRSLDIFMINTESQFYNSL